MMKRTQPEFINERIEELRGQSQTSFPSRFDRVSHMSFFSLPNYRGIVHRNMSIVRIVLRMM